MQEKVLYFLEGQAAGSGFADSTIIHAEVHPPIGRAYFCPICAKTWFQAELLKRPTECINRPCFLHSPGTLFGGHSIGSVANTEVPGSVVGYHPGHSLVSLSKVLITWELWVQLAAFMGRRQGDLNVVSVARGVYDYASPHLEMFHHGHSPQHTRSASHRVEPNYQESHPWLQDFASRRDRDG
jgi:hypothetical protein